jgi:phage terminase large subunit-like protein
MMLSHLAEDWYAFCQHYRLGPFPWQIDAGRQAFARKDGKFVHRIAAATTPRGNGKSWFAASGGVWRLLTGPPPQLILGCALDLEGAKVIQTLAKRLLRSHPDLSAAVELYASEIRVPSTGSRWLIRSREHAASRGLHPDMVLFDEVGWLRDDELFSSLLAAQASVEDPLMLVTSTVGRRQSGPLWRIKELAESDEAIA